VTLPVIDGADSVFVGNPPIGAYNAVTNVWVIGDWCEGKEDYTFDWKFCVTDIEAVDGTYSGVGITTTTQDVVDDSFQIEIKSKCPTIITDGPTQECEVEEVEVLCYETTIKRKQEKLVKVRPFIGETNVATKRIAKVTKQTADCPNGSGIKAG